MDLNDLTKVFVKVAGIIIIIFALAGLPTRISDYFLLNLPDFSVGTFLLMSISPLIIPIFIGYILWQFPGTVANRIVHNDKTNNSETAKEIEIVAFSVLGLYLLFMAVSDIAYHLSFYKITKEVAGDGAILVEPYSLIIATVVEIIFALILLFGSDFLVNLFRKLRS